MKLIKFVAKDWLSFRNVEYTFEDGAKQIKGKNLCETDSQDSNGSGKSSFVEGITKCLLNYTSRKELDRNLVNFDSKEAYLSLSIFCPVRQETLLIERKIKVKGSSESQLSINNTIIHSFEDKMVKEIDKEILEWMDMSTTDLLNFYFISKDKFKSFFSSSNTDKLALINRFSNLSILDGVDSNIKQDVTKKESEIMVEGSKVHTLQGKLQAVTEMLEKEKQVDIKQEIKGRITTIETKNNEYLDKIDELSESVLKLNESEPLMKNMIKIREKSLKRLETLHSNYDLTIKTNELNALSKKKSELNSRLRELKDGNLELEQILTESHEMLHEVERNIKGSVNCPSCNFKFIVGKEDIIIDSEIKRKAEIQELIDSTNGDLEKAKKTVLDFTEVRIKPISEKELLIEKEIQDLKKKNNRLTLIESNYSNKLVEPIKRRHSSLNSEISRIEAQICELMDIVENNLTSIEKLKNEPIINPKIEELKAIVIQINSEIKVQEAVVDKLKDELYNINIWTGHFKRFKMHLATQSLRIVQDFCNKALIDMKSDMRIKLEGFKLKADGSISEEITPYIYRGDTVRSFGSFSAGERARLEYAMIISLQNVINHCNKYGGLNFISSDEAVDGLDSMGLDNVINSLQQFKYPILITSHIQTNFNLNKCLIFVKDSNGSRLETDIEYLKKIFV